jgi:hypothetical protein
MSRGRPAEESAEKSLSYDQGSIRHDLQRGLKNSPGPYPTRRKGIIQPERPSKKARELMKQGKPVVFT